MPTKTSREEILDAATRAFFRDGYHDTKVSGIAAEAGVAQGTFYLYFPAKDAAFLAVIRQFADELLEIASSLELREPVNPDVVVQSFVDLYTHAFEYVAAHREAANLLLLVAPGVSDDARAVRDEVIARIEAITAGYARHGIEQGYFRPLPVKTVARAVTGALLHTAASVIVEANRTRGLRRLAAELIDFEVFGAMPPR